MSLQEHRIVEARINSEELILLSLSRLNSTKVITGAWLYGQSTDACAGKNDEPLSDIVMTSPVQRHDFEADRPAPPSIPALCICFYFGRLTDLAETSRADLMITVTDILLTFQVRLRCTCTHALSGGNWGG
jgi:hypothetical protein